MKELARLIERVASLEPHRVKYTVSLNEVRSDISVLNRPLVEIFRLLQLNVDAAKRKNDELQKNISKTKTYNADKMFTPQIELNVHGLSDLQVI